MASPHSFRKASFAKHATEGNHPGMTDSELISQAKAVRPQAYAPYSQFSVGAALLCMDGTVFTGCNVENLSFGLTNCAERTAIFTAIAAGQRKFQKIAIVSDSKEPVSPCGACRQVMAEFAPELEIICANLTGEVFQSNLSTLLPRSKTGILG
ncbi:MAG: cytidine deaminase [Chthoniobacteraceae bacterium]